MNSRPVEIGPLHRPAPEHDIAALAVLLVDAVESGAAVSFLSPLSHEAAAAWWRETLASSPGAVVLVARDAEGPAGTVQLQPAWAPNQPHRAEVCKLMVHSRARGQGLGRLLMAAAEREARSRGWTLLTLDARSDGPAIGLYRAMGWVEVGAIPRFALNADGTGYHDTVIFYKHLGDDAQSPPAD